jgi:hypothetical protein
MAYGIHGAETAEIESPSIQLTTHPPTGKCCLFSSRPVTNSQPLHLPGSDEITDDIQGKQDKADA